MKKSGVIRLIGRIMSVLSIGFVIYAVWKMGFDFSFVGNEIGRASCRERV